MLAWLIALPCLICASLAPEAMPRDALFIILSKLKFACLYQASYVSKDFRLLADQAIKSVYGIQRHKSIHLNYTLILHELEALVQDAAKTGTRAQANRVLKASLRFQCIQSVLEATFGYCIRYARGNLPEFHLENVHLEILADEHKISVLPYFIDQNINTHAAVCLMRGLLDYGRVDLLNQLTFSRITNIGFYQVLSVSLSEPMIRAAAESLRESKPASKLVRRLASAGFDQQRVRLPKVCKLPLALLWYFHGNRMQISKGKVFVGGLTESSIFFWMNVLNSQAKEARVLLQLVQVHGNDESKCLAKAFHGLVPEISMDGPKRDIYQAMLIRFRFSPIRNRHVVRNYEGMLVRLTKIRYHTACALLDCGQFQLVNRYEFSFHHTGTLEAVIDKLYRLKNANLGPLLRKFVKRHPNAPELLKRLIKGRAEDSYIELIYDSIQRAWRNPSIEHCYCLAPLNVLKSLALDSDIYVNQIQKMLNILAGARALDKATSKEHHALNVVMFWEAPESTIKRFLGLIPVDCRLDHELVRRLLLQPKYSTEFCQRLIHRLGHVDAVWRAKFQALRPELSMESNL